MTPVLILYGSETGNGKALAFLMEKIAYDSGASVEIRNMQDFEVSDFQNYQYAAIIVSTHGIGDPPLAADQLYSSLKFQSEWSFPLLNYSVLALGDKDYALFCAVGKDFDELLLGCGSKQLLPRVDCDIEYETQAKEWMHAFFEKLKTK